MVASQFVISCFQMLVIDFVLADSRLKCGEKKLVVRNVEPENVVNALGVTLTHSRQEVQPWDRSTYSSVWFHLSVIRTSFSIVSWPSKKHIFSVTNQRPRRTSQNSGLEPTYLLRRIQTLSCRWKRWDITSFWDSQNVRRSKRPHGSTMPLLFGHYDAEVHKNGSIMYIYII